MIQLGIIELEPTQRQLKVRGQTVVLGARAFDVLQTLVHAGGAMVSKETLFERVWPGVVVEENNLQVQIAAIRKVLGDDRELIQTVARQGYRLMVERIMDATGTQAGPATPPSVARSTNLPFPVNAIIGRERAVEEICGLLETSRVVTLTGAGGIGKTRLSLEVGHRLLPACPHGVWLVELGVLAAPDGVAARVGDTLGIRTGQHALRLDAIANHIGDQALLLVLDNCEHVLDEAAALAQHIVRSVPNARVLATSREGLGAQGETLYAVTPLDTAACDSGDGAMLPAAVRLFIARMRVLTAQIPADARSLQAVRTLCERLDGIPLAIEIAAAWAPTLGVEQLEARLDDRFRLVMHAQRTCVARHRTLGATLDWSFDLLGEAEQSLLCSLAVFHGGFTLDGALALCPDHLPAMATIGVISALVRKSLLLVDSDACSSRYRLLETTRAYLIGKLHERGEWDRVKKRHARYFMRLLDPMRREPNLEQREAMLRQNRRELDNIRAAVEWSVIEGRDTETGVVLSECAAALMFALSMFEECAWVADHALKAYEQCHARDARLELSLLGMRTSAWSYTLGPTDAVAQAWCDVQRKAKASGETDAWVRATWGLWLQKWYAGEPSASLGFAREFIRIDTPYAETVSLLGARMTGVTAHFAGDQPEARRQLERMIAFYDPAVHAFPIIGTRLDQKRAARVTLARVLWLQGDLGQAIAATRQLVDDCERDAPPLLTGYALLEAAIPIMLMLRRWDAAIQYCEALQRHLAKNRVPIWEPCADCFTDLAAMRAQPAPDRIASLNTNLARLCATNFLTHLSMMRCLQAEALGSAGFVDDGVRVVNEAISRCVRVGELWCLAELLRVRAELSIQSEPPSPDAAERDLVFGLRLAQTQGALFWELRLRKSLARLWRNTDRVEEAREGLRGVYERFQHEGDIADVAAARLMLLAMDG